MRFEDLTTTRKGAIGERIVREFLTAREMIVYQVNDNSHPVDFIVIDQRNELFFAEVKTYPRRSIKPDTGIDKADWYKYAQLASNGVLWLFFVDEIEGCCYVASFEDLQREHSTEGEKVYFPLSVFKVLFTLSRDDLKEIRNVSNVNRSQYDLVKRFFR